MTRRVGAVFAAIVLSLTACSQDSADTASSPSSTEAAGIDLQVIPANYELVEGGQNRFIVGLVTSTGKALAGGSVLVAFLPSEEVATGGAVSATRATYLPVPGTEVPQGTGPTLSSPSTARGVYVLRGVKFEQAGDWAVRVEAQVDGQTIGGQATFPVLEEPAVPAPGERAPATQNLVIGSPGAPKEAIDSRASVSGDIPDPELHRSTIEEAVTSGRPALVVFSTPTYCVSRFCGPVTDTVEAFASRYEDKAEFIHVEIWRDFENNVVNQAAADWLLRDEDLQEPWLFLIDRDGRIAERWDNLFTEAEIEPALNTVVATR